MAHHKDERTFVIIKPDGIQRSLVGEVIKRFERVGLKIIGLKFTLADEKKLLEHYNKDDAWFTEKGERIVEDRKKAGLPIEEEAIEYGRNIIKVLINYMTSGPVVMLALQGNQAAAVVKKLVGETEPATSDVGTIRGDFTVDSYAICSSDDRAVRNLIHCSDSPEEAEREIEHWFSKDELVSYRLIQEEILYDVNLDGILE
ncbi:MAG: nucleoside-diphosphate kinase [Candidatus Paceibacterota bacterium]